MPTFQTPSALWRLISALLISVLPVPSAAQPASPCKALVQIQNNLWLVRTDGMPISQVTNDLQFRSASALHPDGSVIAFSGKGAPDDLTLIDASGRRRADLNLRATQAISGLTWLTPMLLRAEEHVGPNVSHFHFVRLGPANALSIVPAPHAEGTDCAVSPGGRATACIVGGTSMVLNGREIYRSPDPFASATTVQAADVAVGAAFSSSTTPAFRVDVKGVTQETIQLRVTTSDGLWTEQFVPSGHVMDVQLADDAESPVGRYGVLPVSASDPGVVRLRIQRSDPGDYVLEGGIAWDPRGQRMAVVEVDPSGKRTWFLVRREMGPAADGTAHAVGVKQVLPIDGPVRSIAFSSDTRLRIEGESQMFETDIPSQGTVSGGSSGAISQALPQQLAVRRGANSTLAQVHGWSCR